MKKLLLTTILAFSTNAFAGHTETTTSLLHFDTGFNGYLTLDVKNTLNDGIRYSEAVIFVCGTRCFHSEAAIMTKDQVIQLRDALDKALIEMK